jgi:hypothetical protein
MKALMAMARVAVAEALDPRRGRACVGQYAASSAGPGPTAGAGGCAGIAAGRAIRSSRLGLGPGDRAHPGREVSHDDPA